MAYNSLIFLLVISGGPLLNFCPSVTGVPFIYVANTTVGNDTSACWYGGQEKPCSSLTFALEGVHNTSNATYHPGIVLEPVYGGHTLTDTKFSTFNGLSNPNIRDILIVGGSNCSQPSTCVFVECTGKSPGLSFIHVSNITIQNVYFSQGCGAVHNSTSKVSSNSSQIHFAKFRTALFFAFCRDLVFKNVWLENSPGTGVTVYATGGYNVFERCHFYSNNGDRVYPGGGGFYLEFPYCSPAVQDNCDTDISPEYVSNSFYKFTECTFRKNRASAANLVNYTYYLPHGEDHMAFGRGGGLSVFFKGNASNNNIVVDESYFEENTALWGGGIFVEFQDYSNHNHFHVYSTTIKLNEVLQNEVVDNGGGGVRIGYLFFEELQVRYNSILFDHCNFSDNTASFGGGISFYAAREQDSRNATNTLELYNCNWHGNQAKVGAAVILSAWHTVSDGSLVHVKLRNMTVEDHNSTSNLPVTGSTVGVGTLYIDTIPVQFQGYANFHRNDHTALVAINSQIDFLGQCTANFDHNCGRNGGAIALYGSSFIRVHNGTQMNFIGNYAKLQGGAIFSEGLRGYDLIPSRNCFIRYKDIELSPEDWPVHFNFTSNVAAGHNNSIYTTSLRSCLWGGSLDNVFRWSTDWHYSSNSSTEILSDPATFTEPAYTVEVFPGRTTKLPVDTVDDLNNTATYRTVYTAYSLNTSVAAVDNSPRYISDNMIKLYGIPGTSTQIGLYTLDPRVLYVTVNVSLNPCPLGFTTTNSTPDSKNACTCSAAHIYNGYVNCSEVDFTAYLQVQGQWIGRCDDACHNENTIVAGYSPYTYDLSDHQLKLPHDPSKLASQLCGPFHREGTLCGECIEGYSPSINSKNFQCVKCGQDEGKYTWIFYLLTEMLPQTVLFGILLLFNISLTSGPANAFLFFAQVITTSAVYGLAFTHFEAARRAFMATDIIYGIFNLDFLDPLLTSYCLSNNLGTATALALDYVSAFYPIILLVVFFLCSRLFDQGERFPFVYRLFLPFVLVYAKLQQRFELRRAGLVDALIAFLVLSYTKYTNVSIKLLRPSSLFAVDGSHEATVMFFDGTIGYFTQKHTVYFLFATLVLIFLVIPPPLFLILYPIKKLRLFVKRLACGNRESERRWVIELKHFFDAFYGCYKDGQEDENGKQGWDLRSFAGLYFLCRIVFSALDAGNLEYTLQYTVQQIICIGIVLLILIVRPYKREIFNYVDGAIFSILASINALSSFNHFKDRYSTENPPSATAALQYVLIYFPLIYMVSYVILQWCGRRMKKSCATCTRQGLLRSEDDHIGDDSIMHCIDQRAQQESLIPGSRVYHSRGPTASSGQRPSRSEYGTY